MAGMSEAPAALESVRLGFCEMSESVSSLGDEVVRLTQALSNERKYREVVERMLGYGISFLTKVLVNCDSVSDGLKRALDLMRQLRRHRFGRFIDIAQDFDSVIPEKECFSVFESLCARGHFLSGFECGLCYLFGEGVEKDLKKSSAHFRSCSDHGLSFSDVWLGQLLLDGYGDGVEVDKCGAACYFKKSADQGDSQGQWLYGKCLRDGVGVEVDKCGAACYFKKSADQGNSRGQRLYRQLRESS